MSLMYCLSFSLSHAWFPILQENYEVVDKEMEAIPDTAKRWNEVRCHDELASSLRWTRAHIIHAPEPLLTQCYIQIQIQIQLPAGPLIGMMSLLISADGQEWLVSIYNADVADIIFCNPDSILLQLLYGREKALLSVFYHLWSFMAVKIKTFFCLQNLKTVLPIGTHSIQLFSAPTAALVVRIGHYIYLVKVHIYWFAYWLPFRCLDSF